MIQALFIFISILGLLTALGTVLARNLVHAALFLVAFFFIIACQFVLLEAEFLAAIQVLVYIGAVAILLIFGIMLTRNVQGDDTTTVPPGVAIPAVVTTIGFFFVLVFGVNNHIGVRGRGAWSAMTHRPRASDPVRPGLNEPTRTDSIDDMGRLVGREMVNRYAVPFEVAGLLLTAALVGAVALAHRDVEDEAAGKGLGVRTVGMSSATPTGASISTPPQELVSSTPGPLL